MIYPRDIPLARRALAWGVRWALRRRFYGVFVRGAPHLEPLDAPVIFCANHTNWWDGFAAAALQPLFPGRRFYLVQYEKLLARYRFLRWFGVFGMDLDGSALPGLRCALRLLRERRTALWIFPQGVLLPQWEPIQIKPGALWLARRSGAVVVPVAFRYEWMVESRPSLFIHFGAPLPPETPAAALEAELQRLYDAIGATLAPVDLAPYHPLFKPRLSLNKLWDWLRCRDKRSFNPRNE